MHTNKSYDMTQCTNNVETISIKDGDGNEYVFKKPSFEIKLYEVYNEAIFGRVKKNNWQSCSWHIHGQSKCQIEFDLVEHIEPRWEDSIEEMGGVLCFVSNGIDQTILRMIVEFKQDNESHKYFDNLGSTWRYATPIGSEMQKHIYKGV